MLHYLLNLLPGRKHNGLTGYLYLIAVRPTDGHILQYYGPHPGAGNDLNVLYSSNFMNCRDPQEWTIADGIFKCGKYSSSYQSDLFLALPRFLTPRHPVDKYDAWDKAIGAHT